MGILHPLDVASSWVLHFWIKGRGLGGEPLCVRKRLNLRDALPGPILLDLEVVMALEVEPELGGGSEVPGEPQSRICTYRPLAAHDAVHAGGIHADILGQLIRRYLKRLKELKLQDPARVHRRGKNLNLACHRVSS